MTSTLFLNAYLNGL